MAVPADGVYAGWVTRLDAPGPRWRPPFLVGTNPTFDGVERRVEAYVLDRDDLELSDVEIAIDFYVRLRGPGEVRRQGSVDQANARRCRAGAASAACRMSREPKVRMGMPLLSSNPMWEDFGNALLLLWAPKALVRFTTSEGAGGHCETMAGSSTINESSTGWTKS
jgi:hypothetical protein